MIRLAVIAALGSLVLQAAGPAGAAEISVINARIEAVLGDHASYQQAVRAFQVAVEQHDAAAVAALVSYPIEVEARGRRILIRNAATFAARYDEIFTPVLSQAIVEQRYDELMVSQQGVMLGNGQVWINGVCADRSCQKFTPKVVMIQGSP